MELNSFYSLILISLPIGMLHALDADHILAVSSLSCRQPNCANIFGYASKWAAGHGILLLLIASAFLAFHWTLPELIPFLAERLVGIILIAAGSSILLSHLKQHGKKSLPPQYLARSPQSSPKKLHNHIPYFVGTVHGLAGSATVLALIPMTTINQDQTILSGLMYVIVFSLGVLIGMSLFALCWRRVQRILGHFCSPFILAGGRNMLGLCALGGGLYWLAAI